MFQCLEFVAFICLCLAAKTTTEQILPPQNLSLRWINEFNSELTWEPPPHSMANCSYVGKMEKNHKVETFKIEGKSTSCRSDQHYMEGELLRYSLQTVCHDNRSQPAVLNIVYPDLVKSLDFYMISAKQGHCSWTPVITTPELRFFYQLKDLFLDSETTEIQECSSYTYTDGVKSGCNLNATTRMSIRVLLNATVNNTVIRNTFNRDELKVKPPASEWTIKENKNNFNISWIPPDVLPLESWTFQINYKKCDKKDKLPVQGVTYWDGLQRSSKCRYCIWIQATSEFGNSTPTDEKCFDPDRGSYLVYVVIAALVVTLAAISIVCLLRNKKHIFPKIPVPSNFFKDVIENNNESFFRKLYIPPEEQENCTVTVVRDAQTIKPDF